MILVMEKLKQRTKNKISTKQIHAKADALEKYIESGERGELPMSHTGGDISRPLNAMRLAEYHKCKDCQANPVVFIQYKTEKGAKRCVGLCSSHWGKLADTVIGWSE